MELTMKQVLALWPQSISRSVRRWWMDRTEQRYLRHACVEHQIAREAQRNAAHYQKLAAIIRSERGRL